MGGRTAYLSLLIFSIFIYNYYTSSLVSSLLSTKPTLLKTIKELSTTDLKFGMEEQPYTITYILQQSEDIYIQNINRTKIYEHGRPNFWSIEDGMSKVKHGGFAYHTEVSSAYALIAKSYNQKEICDLNEIDFLPPGLMTMMLPKNSQYTKLFMIR